MKIDGMGYDAWLESEGPFEVDNSKAFLYVQFDGEDRIGQVSVYLPDTRSPCSRFGLMHPGTLHEGGRSRTHYVTRRGNFITRGHGLMMAVVQPPAGDSRRIVVSACNC